MASSGRGLLFRSGTGRRRAHRGHAGAAIAGDIGEDSHRARKRNQRIRTRKENRSNDGGACHWVVEELGCRTSRYSRRRVGGAHVSHSEAATRTVLHYGAAATRARASRATKTVI